MLLARLAMGSALAVLLALALVLALPGCRGEPEQPSERPSEPPHAESDSAAAEAAPLNPFAEPARRALRIELGLDDYRRVDGAWAAGDAASTFTAYFAGDTLRFIEEEMNLGAQRERTNVFYFEEGALFYAVQDEIRVRLDPGESTRRDSSRIRIALDPGGGVVASERVLNGAPEPLRGATVVGVRNHAEALREQAIARLREAAEPAV